MSDQSMNSQKSTSDVRNPVTPWDFQKMLMNASDQNLPAAPELNKGVLLYAALNLEEGSEIITGLNKVLDRLTSTENSDPKLMRILRVLNNHLTEAGTQMHEHSLAIKEQLKELPDGFSAEMSHSEVVELADGTTDLCVTNCGFALSMGIDGEACYADVVGSNLSKRNPETMKIDKTGSGKWIKGVNYKEPNLEQVIYCSVESKG